MKKRITKEILNKKVFTWLLLFFVLAMIAPLLYIGQYNHMSGDCYWYGFKAYIAWLNTHSFLEVIKAGIENTLIFWKDWQGTYSSVFLFSVTPGIFGEGAMILVPYIMIGMTLVSNLALYYIIFVRFLKSGLYYWIIFTLMSFFMQIEFMYTPASGLYWYNGAVHYVFMQGVVCLNISLSLYFFYRLLYPAHNLRVQKGRIIECLIFMIILGFFSSGANFSSTLLNMEISVLFLVSAIYFFRKKKIKEFLYFLIPFAVTLFGFLLNIAAPGNGVRQGSYTKMQPLEAIINALSYAFSQMLDWVDIFVVLCLLLLLPFVLKFVYRNSFSFRYAPFLLLLSYCLYSSMFVAGFYATGSEPLSRNQNICKMFLIMLLVFNEVYLTGWMVKKIKGKWMEAVIPEGEIAVWCWSAYLGVVALLFLISFLSLDFVPKKANFVSYGAWDVIETGDGKKYKEEYLIRLHEYKTSEEKEIYVSEYTVKPYPIYVSQTTEESNREDGMLEQVLAKWYGKVAIYEIKKE